MRSEIYDDKFRNLRYDPIMTASQFFAHQIASRITAAAMRSASAAPTPLPLAFGVPITGACGV